MGKYSNMEIEDAEIFICIGRRPCDECVDSYECWLLNGIPALEQKVEDMKFELEKLNK